MSCSKWIMDIGTIISLVLLLIGIVLGQQLDDDITLAKLVPQVSNTRCFYDIHCLEEKSYCTGNDVAAKKSGFCACKEDRFIQLNGKEFQCISFVEGFGSSCIVDRQCVTALASNFAYCDSKEGCQCDDGYHFHENTCYKTVAINGTCQSAHNCLINVFKYGSVVRNGFAHCVHGRCSCGLNEHHRRDSNTCVTTIPIGGVCSSDDECNITDEWAVCRLVCTCRAGWVVEDRGLSCLRAANEVGEPCTQLAQCTEFLGADSLCDLSTNTCQCKSHAHHVGTKCFQRRHLGDTCTNKMQCQIGQDHYTWPRTGSESDVVDCVDGVCQCVSDAEQRGSQCVRQWEDGGARNGMEGSDGSAMIVLATSIILFLFCVK